MNTLDSLQLQLAELLDTYTTTQNNYVSSLNSDGSNGSSTPQFLYIPHAAYTGGGTSILNVVPTATVNACESTCSSTTGCIGATYNTTTGCAMVRGTTTAPVANVVGAGAAAEGTTTAIVPPRVYYSYQLQQLNREMRDVYRQIERAAQTSAAGHQAIQQEAQAVSAYLRQQFAQLRAEKEKIDALARETRTTGVVVSESELTTDTQYMWYWFFLLIFVVLVLLLRRTPVVGGGQRGGSEGARKHRRRHTSSGLHIFMYSLAAITILTRLFL